MRRFCLFLSLCVGLGVCLRGGKEETGEEEEEEEKKKGVVKEEEEAGEREQCLMRM